MATTHDICGEIAQKIDKKGLDHAIIRLVFIL